MGNRFSAQRKIPQISVIKILFIFFFFNFTLFKCQKATKVWNENSLESTQSKFQSVAIKIHIMHGKQSNKKNNNNT